MRDGHVGNPLIFLKNVHGAFSCMSIVVEGHSAHFMVFWDGVGAKREQMTCWVLPRGDLLRREFRVLICREPPRTADGTSPAPSIGLSNTKQGGGPNGIRAVVGQDLTFAIRGVAIRP